MSCSPLLCRVTSGSTRANKPVPRSAVVHGSVKYVPSSERHKSRKSQTASAMTQRVPVSPPVSGHHYSQFVQVIDRGMV